jgi:hypothetical protein
VVLPFIQHNAYSPPSDDNSLRLSSPAVLSAAFPNPSGLQLLERILTLPLAPTSERTAEELVHTLAISSLGLYSEEIQLRQYRILLQFFRSRPVETVYPLFTDLLTCFTRTLASTTRSLREASFSLLKLYISLPAAASGAAALPLPQDRKNVVATHIDFHMRAFSTDTEAIAYLIEGYMLL